MKTISKITIGLMTSALLIIGCNGMPGKVPEKEVIKPARTISEESLGLRNTGIYAEEDTLASKTEYRGTDAGASTKITRAFQDAPPMIPHAVGDYLPITKEYNACVGCHMPDVAGDMGATPIPNSHFLDMRPKDVCDGVKFKKAVDEMKNETSIKKIDHLSTARYNCSQCHAPQSQGNLAVENTFEATYTKKDGAFKSSWDEVIYDSLDTTGVPVTAEDIANKDSAAGKLNTAKH